MNPSPPSSSDPPLQVPPRRGQRTKSKTLSPFNGGNEFRCAKIRCIEDGEDVYKYGIVEKKGKMFSSVWIEHDLFPVKVENKNITLILCPPVPKNAYEEFSAVIGGIGKHIRWYVILPSKHQKTEVSLTVKGVLDQKKFKLFVDEVIRPFGLCKFEFSPSSDTEVIVPDASRTSFVASAFHCANYKVVFTDKNMKYGKLAIERYDRSEHMWWNQDQKNAGPLRDVHRWSFSFIPIEWKHVPFTWQSLALNIDVDECEDLCHIPLPLRNYVCDNLSLKAKNEGDHEREGKILCKKQAPCVTCRLSRAQNNQLLEMTYWSMLAPFDKETVKIANLIRFRFMMFGYTSREIGAYNQTASYLGHGAQIREFKNKPQYKIENLSSDVLNTIYRSDGVCKGSGFKGTRGKYGHKDFPKYEPEKRMKRTRLQEELIRNQKAHVFNSYKNSSANDGNA